MSALLRRLHEASENFIENCDSDCTFRDPCDLKTEIAQLKFQVQNLREECCELKKQNSQFQDENLQLIVSILLG